MDDIYRYIGRTVRFAKANKNQELANIASLLATQGLSITDVSRGIKVDRYIVTLPATANIKKVLRLEDNIKIAVNSSNVSMAIHGNTLTIDTPGNVDETLLLGDCYESFKDMAGIPLMMGKAISGEDIIIDLAKQPHMLIGGTTGSGKSMLCHSIIASVLLHDPHTEIYAVDMKGSEFNVYAKYLRNFHLVSTEWDAECMLRDLVNVMESRYATFAKYGYRDIESARANGYDIEPIVVVMDELADLMLKSGKTIEPLIVSLAQKSRAAGIHLVLATQSPRKTVITGLIKANIPCRVCLHVADGLESRIVFDRMGGEKLLGHGDMLLMRNGDFEPIRVQGCYLSEKIMKNVACISAKIVRAEEPKEEQATEEPKEEPNEEIKEEPVQEKPSFFKQTSFYQVFSAIKRMAVGM